MRARANVFPSILFILLAISLGASIAHAQCYLNQGCKPVDFLNYQPSGPVGQVYHGDGASNNGAGGWTNYYSDVNQCLSCHYGTDTYPYLMTGHKNTLRKFAPGVLWGGPDDNIYLTTDDHYGSGSTYNWTTNQVTLGWCDPLGTIALNGLNPVDPFCQYPYYTLPNPNAPAPYNPVAQTVGAGGVRNLFYLYGGWQNYGGQQNPTATHLNSVFDSGFTGDIYPRANFDCARCHATGYNFSAWGPEPTSNTNDQVTPIPDAQFSRLPSDGYVAPGTNGTSSWYLTGIQCERCHVAAWGYGSHPEGGLQATIAQNEAATALCMECHREESITMAQNGNGGSINPANTMMTRDHGYCSDLSGSLYPTCVANPSNQWIYKPYVDHEPGQAFLNGSHARFSGSLIQNTQNSADLSITISGAYASQFTETLGDPTKNLGCTGCHDPHQSTVAQVSGAKPIATTCDQCHTLAQTLMQTINHPAGPGTPFPTGAQSDIPGACITCHMQGALGRANSHLFRISSDPNYRTFPTPAQLYTQNITALGIETEYSEMDGSPFTPANWLDVDLACGQCHVGNDGVTNEYGLTLPPGMPGAHAYTRAQLAYWASVMHGPDPGVPTPTFSPAPGTFHSPQTVTITDATVGATIYYTMDGKISRLFVANNGGEHDHHRSAGGVSENSAEQHGVRHLLDCAPAGATAHVLADPVHVQRTGNGKARQHTQLTDVLHARWIHADNQFDSVCRAHHRIAEHNHQCDHGGIWVHHQPGIERNLPDPGAHANDLARGRHVLQHTNGHHLRHRERGDDLLHDQWIGADNVVDVVREPMLGDGGGDDNAEGNRVRRRIHQQQRSRGGLHDCGGDTDVLAGGGDLLQPDNGDDQRHDERRDDLLHDEWIVPNVVIAVVHESVHGAGGGDDDNPGDRGGEWDFAEWDGGRGVYDCREHADLLAAFRNLFDGADGNHLRHDERRNHLLHN